MLSVDHVVKTAGLGVPELRVEAPARLISELAQKCLQPRIAELMSKIAEDSQRVVPERLNFDRFPRSRRYHPIADLGIHPRQLNAWLSAGQQSVAIGADAVAGSAKMPLHDLLQL